MPTRTKKRYQCRCHDDNEEEKTELPLWKRRRRSPSSAAAAAKEQVIKWRDGIVEKTEHYDPHAYDRSRRIDPTTRDTIMFEQIKNRLFAIPTQEAAHQSGLLMQAKANLNAAELLSEPHQDLLELIYNTKYDQHISDQEEATRNFKETFKDAENHYYRMVDDRIRHLPCIECRKAFGQCTCLSRALTTMKLTMQLLHPQEKVEDGLMGGGRTTRKRRARRIIVAPRRPIQKKKKIRIHSFI